MTFLSFPGLLEHGTTNLVTLYNGNVFSQNSGSNKSKFKALAISCSMKTPGEEIFSPLEAS